MGLRDRLRGRGGGDDERRSSSARAGKGTAGKGAAGRPRLDAGERDFLEQVTAAFDGAPGVTGLEPGGTAFELVLERAEGPLTVPLADVYADSASDSPAERAERVRRLVEAHTGLPPTGPRTPPGGAGPGSEASRFSVRRLRGDRPPAATARGLSGAGARPWERTRSAGPDPGSPGWVAAQSRLLPGLHGLARLGVPDARGQRPAGRASRLPYLAELLVLTPGSAAPGEPGAPDPEGELVDWAMLHEWGVGLEEASSKAWARLAASAVPLSERRTDDGRLLVEHPPGDAQAAARLLVPGWLRGVETRLGSRLVVGVPAREELWAVPADDVTGLRWLTDTVREAFLGSPSRVSPLVFATDDAGAVVPWAPAPDDPLAVPVAGALRVAAVTAYEAQRDHLGGAVDVAGVAHQVAPLATRPTPDGGLLSVTEWQDAVPALLPDSDLLRLVPDPGRPDASLLVRREDAALVLERWTEPAEGLVPARRRTTGFPDAESLAELRGRAGQV